MSMRDGEIRSALVSKIRAEHPDPLDTRIWPEMSLVLGASRVDVGVVNGALSGYEIKSERDNLGRLPRQIEHYSKCLDYAWIVTGGRYHERVLGVVPDWWGVLVAEGSAEGHVNLCTIRPARENPQIDPFHVAQLLWRDEAQRALEERGSTGLSKLRRWDLWDLLVESLALDDLRRLVRDTLKARSGPPDR